jgi:hypothetical protein
MLEHLERPLAAPAGVRARRSSDGNRTWCGRRGSAFVAAITLI